MKYMQQNIKQPEESEYKAQKCPVCNGFGTLKYGTLVCHGCGGKGWVLIPGKIDRAIDIYEQSKQ
jgi:DnaJ-class molecular chaperone